MNDEPRIPALTETSQKMLTAFFDSLPKNLEPILLLNNKGALGDGGERFNLNIFNSDRVADERVTLILEVLGFLFCPDHEDSIPSEEAVVELEQTLQNGLNELTSDDVINSIRTLLNKPEEPKQ